MVRVVSVANIQVPEALALQSQGAQLIDVREGAEWRRGHAVGAIHRPLAMLDLTEFDADRPLLFVCASGGRSMQASRAAAAAGFRTYNLLGGMALWEASGQPIVRD
jgi:rhodanese-related sulfurtransferase